MSLIKPMCQAFTCLKCKDLLLSIVFIWLLIKTSDLKTLLEVCWKFWLDFFSLFSFFFKKSKGLIDYSKKIQWQMNESWLLFWWRIVKRILTRKHFESLQTSVEFEQCHPFLYMFLKPRSRCHWRGGRPEICTSYPFFSFFDRKASCLNLCWGLRAS